MDIWVNDSFLPHFKEPFQFKTFLNISTNQAKSFFSFPTDFLIHNVVTLPCLTIEMSKPRKSNVSLVTQHLSNWRLVYFYGKVMI